MATFLGLRIEDTESTSISARAEEFYVLNL